MAMNKSPPIPGQAGAGEPTTAYHGSGAPGGGQPVRLPVALVSGARPLQFAEGFIRLIDDDAGYGEHVRP